MAGHRQEKINVAMAEELAGAIRTSRDPRLSESVISVTEVDCAKDLKSAKVYFSFYAKKYTVDDVGKALKGAEGYLRSHLARTLNLRETPRLFFAYDDSVERGNRIASILREVTAEFKDEDEPQE